jgi:hypothetical protein
VVEFRKVGGHRWESQEGVVIEWFEGFPLPYRVFVRGTGTSIYQFETLDKAFGWASLAPLAALDRRD